MPIKSKEMQRMVEIKANMFDLMVYRENVNKKIQQDMQALQVELSELESTEEGSGRAVDG